MEQISHTDPLIQNLRIEDIAVYLHETGWQRTPHPNDRLLVFTGGSDDRKPLFMQARR